MKTLKAMRNEFLYWYPVDMRNSAKELIPNHLTFYAFHHAALFEQKHWPRGFSVNGMIQIEGQKMSKSRNVFVTWRHALEQYGADGLRATLALAADGMDDADWKAKNAEDISSKIDSLFPFIEKGLADSAKRKPELSDRWLLSVVRGRIDMVTKSLEEMKIRKAALGCAPRRLERHPLVPQEGGEAEVRDAQVGLRDLDPPRRPRSSPSPSEELNSKMGNKGLITHRRLAIGGGLPARRGAPRSPSCSSPR